MRKGRAGLPLFEIALWLVLAGLVLLALERRIDRMLELAEKTAVETSLMHMRSGLRLEKARRIAAGQSLHDLAGRDPLEFLQPPAGQGEAGFPALAQPLGAPAWRFDAQSRTLVYRPERQRQLKISPPGADKLLMWRTLARTPGGDDIDIVSLTLYEWF